MLILLARARDQSRRLRRRLLVRWTQTSVGLGEEQRVETLRVDTDRDWSV